MAPGEPILLLCHAFPPVLDIGGRRWAKFAKELAKRGHPVHVIHSEPIPGTAESPWMADAKQPNIHRHPLPRLYPSVLRRTDVHSLGDKLRYHAWTKLLPLICKGNWYDESIFWRKPLLNKATKLMEMHGIRHVVATGAPFRMLAYGAELKKRFPQVGLVVDFRDAWTWAGSYGLGSIGVRRLRYEQHLEAVVMHAAARVISPSPGILGHLRATYPAIPAEHFIHVPHCVDPEDLDNSAPPVKHPGFRMVYAGSLYGAGEADVYFDQLLNAFTALRETRPEVFATCGMDLYITGHGTAKYEQLVAARGLSGTIRFHAPLPSREAFRRVRASDLVVLFIPSGNRDIVGTKFQEIFYTGTPILHVGEPGIVSRTVEGKRMGASIRVEEVAAELPKIIRRKRVIEVDKHADHSAYLLPKVTDRLLAEVLI